MACGSAFVGSLASCFHIVANELVGIPYVAVLVIILSEFYHVETVEQDGAVVGVRL